jgi:phage-related protein
MRPTRPVSWLTAARRAFDGFPEIARETIFDALTIAAEGGKAAIAKPMKGLGSGVFEIALAHRGDAFRVVYAVQLGDDLWVLHAFQKKSTQGIKTPKREIDLIRDRIKRLKEILR